MRFRIIQRFLLAAGLCIGLSTAVFAQDCSVLPSLLIQSCQSELIMRLRVLPDDTQPDSNHLLSVTGTYSSGDRFGIEGLVIKAGKTVSRRYKNWDGVLIIERSGVPSLFNAKDVILGGESYNLKDKPQRDGFITKAKGMGVTVLQSHLLISNGTLDLKDVKGAPTFKRRLFVTFRDGSFAVWQTALPETLYDAARQVQDALNPEMALNLDMGAYDYCRRGPKGGESDCGSLRVSADKLTNLLEFAKP